MVECKTADPRTNLTEAKSRKRVPDPAQMGLVRELTHYKPTHSVLSYTDASFWYEVKEFVVPFDPGHVRGSTLARDGHHDRRLRSSAVPPEGWIAGGHECKYCPFTKACGIERRNLPFQDIGPEVDPQFKAEIIDLVKALKKAEARRDQNDEWVRGLQIDIKDRLREKGVKKIPGVLSWSEVKGRQSFDNKALREAAIAAGVDVEQFSTVGDATDRLLIQIS